jgi:hypothetical protein
MIEDSNDPLDRIHNARLDAEKKAWDNLGRYKFNNFGYWAAAWIHYNQLMPKEQKLGNPFISLVKMARKHQEENK